MSSISYTGLVHTRRFIVDREFRTVVGQPLRLDVLEADLRRIDGLGIFASARATGQPDGEGVALDVAFKESVRRLGYHAISYTEQNGWSYGVGATLLNLGGRNILLSGRILFGGVDWYEVEVADPWFGGRHAGYVVGFSQLRRLDKLNGFLERSQELSPWLTTHLGEKGRIGASVGFFRMGSDVPGKTLSPSNEDRFARLGVQVGYDSRDSSRDPRRGWYGQAELWRTEGSGEFWSTNVDVRRFQPVRRQKLELSALLSLQSGEVSVNVPQYLQYRLGGANSIRGHHIEALGAEIYGKNQLLATAEYVVALLPRRYVNPLGRLPVSVGVDLTFFGDAGTAWSDPRAFATDRFRGGIGAGVRFLIPALDQVRLEYAWSREEGFVFHFASGAKLDNQRKRIR